MPESPECRIFSDSLASLLQSQSLHKIDIIGGKFLKHPIDFRSISFSLSNASFHTKGKLLYWKFDNNISFIFGLGMTGSFSTIRNKHSAIYFQFDNQEIFFNDIRHFGSFKILTSSQELSNKLSTLGWDPLSEPIPFNMIYQIRKHNHKRIGEFLLEQNVISGLGNYLRIELLYRTKISPFKLISNLTDIQLQSIIDECIKITQESYSLGGATLSTYYGMNGEIGRFAEKFQVYGRRIDPNGYLVLKTKDKTGRTIHYVPEVQK